MTITKCKINSQDEKRNYYWETRLKRNYHVA